MKESLNLRAGNLHTRENITQTANITSVSSTAEIFIDGASIASLAVTGTYTATLALQGTVDGVTWFGLPLVPVASASALAATPVLTLATANLAGIWQCDVRGFNKLRIACSSFTSGSAACTLVVSNAMPEDYPDRTGSSVVVTATGAAAAAVTCTLPAPGLGLRNYISSVEITRFATVLLTAAATPILTTGTNLPGTLVYTLPADAAALGTTTTLFRQYTPGIPATSQNATAAVTAPVTTGVIWRIILTGYAAP